MKINKYYLLAIFYFACSSQVLSQTGTWGDAGTVSTYTTTGPVGIGTSTPVTTSLLHIRHDGDGNNGILVETYATSSTYDGAIEIQSRAKNSNTGHRQIKMQSDHGHEGVYEYSGLLDYPANFYDFASRGLNIYTDNGRSLKFVTRPSGSYGYSTADIQMVINDQGNVGIGITAPTGKLHSKGTMAIEATGNSNKMTIFHDGSNSYINSESGQLRLQQGGSTKVYIESNGNVGVGTWSPGGALHVNHSSDEAIVIGSGTVESTNRPQSITFTEKNAGAGGRGIRWLDGAGNYTIVIYGNTSSDNSMTLATKGDMRLKTGATPTEHVTIAQDGKVGIGTTSPSAALDIEGGNVEIGGRLDFGTSSAFNGADLDLSLYDNTYGSYQKFISLRNENVDGDAELRRLGIAFSLAQESSQTGSDKMGAITVESSLAWGNEPSMNFWTANAQRITITQDGKVGIGTLDPQSLLAVKGKITAQEVEVTLSGWSDFVFKDNYNLKSLEEVKDFIDTYGHLPDVPSEVEVLENGIGLGKMDAVLLQKIEELTLYVIQLEKENNRQNEIIQQLSEPK